MSQLRLIAVVLILAACETPKVWTQGPVPSGVGLNDNQRMATYDNYVVSRVAYDRVWIREKSKEVPYSLESFGPVARDLDPTIEARIAASHHAELWTIPAIVAGAYGSSYLTQTKINDRQRYAAISVVALSFLIERFFNHTADTNRQAAIDTYRNALDHRLFP